jgi:hypothetical protein
LTKENILSGCKGDRAYRLVERVGFGVRVNSDAAEVGAKGPLHLQLHASIEGLPAPTLPFDSRLDTRVNTRLTLALPC